MPCLNSAMININIGMILHQIIFGALHQRTCTRHPTTLNKLKASDIRISSAEKKNEERSNSLI